MTKIIPALIIFLFTWSSFAADPNGYTSQYECRAGGPNCNVDVAAYVAAACAQTITTADSASTINNKLNSGSSPICIVNGDYTGKGTFTLTTSGASGARRVLRYTRSGDNNDDPWNQSNENQARIKKIVINASYWIIHRLTFPSNSTTDNQIRIQGNATNIIFNRIYQTNCSSECFDFTADAGATDSITLQNSALLDSVWRPGIDTIAITICSVKNFHLVNNEFRDSASHAFQASECGGGVAGLVIENNDFYLTSSSYGNCGEDAGSCTGAEAFISLKDDGISTNPVRIIHNRIYGMRNTDTSIGSNGASGSAVAFGSGGSVNADWILFQNNIVGESQNGIEWTMWDLCNRKGTRTSIIGNLFHSIIAYKSGGTSATWWSGCGGVDTTEFYLNTIIDSDRVLEGNFDSNNDLRCNVKIAIKNADDSSLGTGTLQDYNAYFAAPENGENNKFVKTVATRANSKTYSIGDLMVPTSLNNYIYRAVVAGTTSNSAPTPCTVLGCTFTDGGVTWQSIRGPYTFFRKLRTSPESYTIPYARAHASTPEVNTCPSDYATRRGVGINDIN
jgi:hypothetical protein